MGRDNPDPAATDGYRLLRSIVVVGGGTAGWMTAAALSQWLDPQRVRITLVESPEIGSVGVGEATVPSIVGFLRWLKADEAEFMRACHASWKLAIRFDDWQRPGSRAWHPFGPVGGTINGRPVFQHWLRATLRGAESRPFTSLSLQACMAEAGKAPCGLAPELRETVVTRSGAYAYHLDAGAFAGWLRERSVKRGVHHVADRVTGAEPDGQGGIARVLTAAHGTLEADLFVDCSGFNGLLAERALDDPWIDWGERLLCDRAVVMPLPEDAVKAPYTLSAAQEAGWIWRIPLAHRVGSGYVYASRFVDDERAADTLLRFHAPRQGLQPPRVLRMRVGRRTQFWRGNCVAIGLAAGFVEPLESTGLFLIQRGIELLGECLPAPRIEPELRRLYDERMGEAMDEVRDFIVLHYLLSEREDTPFWRAARAVEPGDSLRRRLARYDALGQVDDRGHALFAEASWHAICAGFGRLPRAALPAAELSDFDGALQVLAKIRAQNEGLVGALPPHEAMLAALRRSPLSS
jgi:tryptophan 7-halogenase